ncbi:MAG TPA: VOC family protein [Candidatus Limnocylindria bacterium]|nr:VOC family protein [Candidatus Limnocylindria bacterium]
MAAPDHRHHLGPIMQVLVPVTDVDRATEFYERVLGLHLLFPTRATPSSLTRAGCASI